MVYASVIFDGYTTKNYLSKICFVGFSQEDVDGIFTLLAIIDHSYGKEPIQLAWKQLQTSIDNLYQRKDEYPVKARDMVTEFKSIVARASSKYLATTRQIYEWSKSTVQLLDSYIEFTDNSKISNIKMQNDIVEKLDTGSKKLESTHIKLGKVSSRYL